MNNIKVHPIIAAFLILATAVCYGETLTVGKGAQFEGIKEALESAADGDLIVIKAGNYSQDSSLYIDRKSNLEIKGEGKVNVSCTQYLPVFYLMNCKEITIRNLHGYHQIKDPEIGKGECGPGATIISAENCTGISIIACELNGCGQTGFESWSCNKIVLNGNYIHDNVNSAIAIFQPYLKTIPEIRIENNRIENNYGPFILQLKEGLLNFYSKDSAGVTGVIMIKNKWKNNNLMPKVAYTANEQKIVFRGKPGTWEGKDGKEILGYGLLYADSVLTVGNKKIAFSGNSYLYFHENGAIREGYSAKAVTLTIDGTEYNLPAGGKQEFYESGVLKEVELEDGRFLQFKEDGNLR